MVPNNPMSSESCSYTSIGIHVCLHMEESVVNVMMLIVTCKAGRLLGEVQHLEHI